VFVFFYCVKGPDETFSEYFPQWCAILQRSQCLLQSSWQVIRHIVSIAGDRFRWLELVHHSEQTAGKAGGDDQIGVGVCSGYPVFDAP